MAGRTGMRRLTKGMTRGSGMKRGKRSKLPRMHTRNRVRGR